jgi:hypothetical protein
LVFGRVVMVVVVVVRMRGKGVVLLVKVEGSWE